MAYSALKNGISPPKVRAVEMRGGERCRRAKLESIIVIVSYLSTIEVVRARKNIVL